MSTDFTQLFFVLFTPLVVGGLVRIVTDKFKWLAYPLDCGKMFFDNERIFGSSKTLGGFLTLTGVSGLVGLLLTSLALPTPSPWYGIMLGVWYQCGELINSFFKRRKRIEPGKHAHVIVRRYCIDSWDGIAVLSLGGVLFWNLSVINGLLFFIIGGLVHIFIDSLNHIFFSKKNADKKGIIAFYQWIFYTAASPLRVLISRNGEALPRTNQLILAANHPFFLDALFVLRSLSPKEFYTLVPFRYIIHDNFYSKPLLKPFVVLTGGISSKWQHYFDDKPLEALHKNINDGYTLYIPFEGRRTTQPIDPDKLAYGLYKLVSNANRTLIPITLESTPNKYSVTVHRTPDKLELTTKETFYTQLNSIIYESLQ